MRRHWDGFELFDLIGEIYDEILEKCDKLGWGWKTEITFMNMTERLENLLDEFATINDELDTLLNPDTKVSEEENKVMSFVSDILALYEFDIDTQGSLFRLYDIQWWNLWDIEWDRFETLAEVIGRLWIYHEDYIYRSLEEREEAGEKIKNDDRDLTVKHFIENDNVAKILEEITPRKRRQYKYKHYNTKDIMLLYSNI